MKTLKQIKKIVIAITGFTVLLLGLIMVFLPGPSIIVIPMGLAILASEFVWAEQWLFKVKGLIAKTTSTIIKRDKNN